ncbi:EAL domain-containing protein [Pseudomonas aeruginosa]|uniref:EAL domain-containing protein n=1 Tax=Pseudomonas aeruginosa TaxID=287 RepID=UPI002409E0FB|nr:EAL domain-containing protein [Pseudomonas aeruginosa]
MSAFRPDGWTTPELAQAVERGQLELHYQPVVDLRSGGIVGAEALLRWRHPTLGLLPPGQFLPVVESSGLMPESALGCWAKPAARCVTGECWHGDRSGWPSMFRRAKWDRTSTGG